MTIDEIRGAALTCIICGRELEPAFPEHDEMNWIPQPYGGTWFYSHGQYGSTVYDEMHGDYLLVTICDEDLLKLAQRGLVLERKPSHQPPKPEPETSVWNPAMEWVESEGRAMWSDPGQQTST